VLAPDLDPGFAGMTEKWKKRLFTCSLRFKVHISSLAPFHNEHSRRFKVEANFKYGWLIFDHMGRMPYKTGGENTWS
jgi:hypothetical protein